MVQQAIQGPGYVLQPWCERAWLTQFAATRKPNALRENQKQAVSHYGDTRNMQGDLTGETVMPR